MEDSIEQKPDKIIISEKVPTLATDKILPFIHQSCLNVTTETRSFVWINFHNIAMKDTVLWPQIECQWLKVPVRGCSWEHLAGGGIHVPLSEEDKENRLHELDNHKYKDGN